ncbi:MAG: aspartate kinase [Gammaproteobacteria bacterium RBG_16_51_14]|nr:MAG: aspartate kinase [Gammaproteobacteria bacterium RBG_16_51_14]
MSLIVQKYGGTSVGSIDRIMNVADRVIATRKEGHDIVVVVSAMSGETDRLLDLAKEISDRPSGRELDVLLSTGEQVTIALLSMALEKKGFSALSYTGAQVYIRTDSVYNKARIIDIDGARVNKALHEGKIVVVAGFQGSDEHGNITTLGRGGSDTTAVAMAAALKADECQIYTDVDGVYTADPRIVPEARLLTRMTFEEMLELASLGSKVLQIRSVEFARKYNVKLRVLSAFTNNPGTLITAEDEENMEQALISGVTYNRNEAKLTIVGVPDKPGIAFKILGPIADANIEVDMIVQNVGEDNTTDLTFTVNRNDFENALDILKNTAVEMDARDVKGDKRIVKISVVGVGMRSHAGIASEMFKALADEGINIQMISTSEIKISVVVDEKYLELGVRTLHSAFGLENNTSPGGE